MASVSGEFNGAQQKVSELVGHKVPYAPSQTHRTNTAVEHSYICDSGPIVIAGMFATMEELHDQSSGHFSRGRFRDSVARYRIQVDFSIFVIPVSSLFF